MQDASDAKHHTSLCENVDKQVKPPTPTITESQPPPPATKSTVGHSQILVSQILVSHSQVHS